ncbi:MAG: sulfite exporter TauE/SafE family protein [Alphaproteobacteria bacterium]|nr:sulfite exporter TauE/SafE family protein [Alphaproteobacteria bacterium]
MEALVPYLPLALGLLGAGVVAGITAGLLGVGGGIVMVPAIALVLETMGFDKAVYQHVAVGTSLAVIIVTGLSSARAHYLKGVVMTDILRLWAPPMMVAALIGGLMARLYPGDVLRVVFGVVALFVALNIVLPIQRLLMGSLSGSPLTHRISATLVGYLSALMGVGGGALSVPTLVAFGHRMHKAVGTGAALGVLIAVPGTLGFIISGFTLEGRPPLSLGYVNLPALFLVGLTASLFAPVGAALAHRLDQVVLKRVFAIYLLVVGGRMILQALG